MIVYGRNPIREALRGRRASAIKEVWATTGAAREPWLSDVKTRIVESEEITERCGSTSHQGICAEAGGYPYTSADQLLGRRDPFLVVLDEIQDPQNLGSICRTAECVGVTGVIIPERRSAEVTPAVCKSSAGAVEHLAIAKVRNVADFLLEAKQAECWCYGASADGETVSYEAPDYSGGAVLVLGSEGNGIRPRVAGACDQLISLPLRGSVESLGVSAAAAAILYRMLHDRQSGLDKA